MPSRYIHDAPAETVAALKRRAARHEHSGPQALRDVLATAAAEPVTDSRSRELRLQTVATGREDTFDRADFYDDDGR